MLKLSKIPEINLPEFALLGYTEPALFKNWEHDCEKCEWVLVLFLWQKRS